MLAAPVCSALTDVIDYFDTVENLKHEDGGGLLQSLWSGFMDVYSEWTSEIMISCGTGDSLNQMCSHFTFHPVTKTFLTRIHFVEDLSLPLSSPRGSFWLHSADWHFLCVGDSFQMSGSGSWSTRTFSLSSGLCCLPVPPLCECWDSTCRHVQEWSVLCRVSRSCDIWI